MKTLLLRLLLRLVLTVTLLWVLTHVLGAFAIGGGVRAYLTIAVLLTVFNLVLRPLLTLATLPLKLFSGILAGMLVNVLFLLATIRILQSLGPASGTLEITGGPLMWLLAALLLGLTQFLP